MGTRNLICVVKDNKYCVAQYCQWDGYPAGQGQHALDFLNNKFDKDLFSSKIDSIKIVTDAMLQGYLESCGADPNSEWMSGEVAARFEERYPHLERGFGSKILSYVQESKNPEIVTNITFASDGLFCEWCYVLDLDKSTFEVFKGFNKEEPFDKSERFFFLNSNRANPDYTPVKLLKSFHLSDLPKNLQDSLPMEEK